MTDALVIFEHNNLHPLSGALKLGYRHVWCAVIDESAHAWVAHDLRLEGYSSAVMSAPDYPLAEHLRDQGKEVIEITRSRRRPIGPVIMNNCVGLTKAVCGIRSWAVTPWQLRQHLIRQKPQDQPWNAF